eukprot:scaffold11028_cov57-Phaeocystis_antarctica.AAC.5
MTWGCSPEERSRLYSERKRPLCTIPGAGATLRPYRPQWCRSLTTCNSRRRARRRQTAAASSLGCAT